MPGLFPDELIDRLNVLLEGSLARPRKNPRTRAELGTHESNWHHPLVDALHICTPEGDQLAMDLIRCGVLLNPPAPNMGTPLTHAIERLRWTPQCWEKGHELDAIKALLAAGARPSPSSPDDQALCKMAATFPVGVPHNEALQAELMDLLLAHGADPMRIGSLGKPALHRSHDPGFIRALVGRGVPIDIRDEHGRTTFMNMLAYPSHLLDCARTCLALGASIHARDKGGLYPLFFAVFHNHPKMARHLLKKGVPAESGSPDHPLIHVALHCCPALLPDLLAKGCDPAVTGQYGWDIFKWDGRFIPNIRMIHGWRPTLEPVLQKAVTNHQKKQLEKALPLSPPQKDPIHPSRGRL